MEVLSPFSRGVGLTVGRGPPDFLRREFSIPTRPQAHSSGNRFYSRQIHISSVILSGEVVEQTG